MELELQLVAVVAAAVLVGASVAYWRHAIAAALLLLVFEGALRKWVLPEAQAYLYGLKDFLLLGAYIGCFATKGLRLPVPQARLVVLLLALSAAYGTLELFNPALPSMAVAAVGWRSYFFYAPLLLLVPHLFASSAEMGSSLRRYALLALPVAALGIVQFYSAMDAPINTNVQHEPGVAGLVSFGSVERARVGGTFSFVSGYASYLLAVALLLAALLGAQGWRLRGNLWLYCTLGLTMAAMFATGSRAPVYLLVAAVVLYAVTARATGDLSLGATLRACFAAAALALLVWYFLPEPAEAFYQRAAETSDTASRLVSPFVEPFLILEDAGVSGFGIGAAHQSAAFLVGSPYSWWTNGIVAEAETSRVMLELGLIGFVLIFAMRLVIALIALRAAFAQKSRDARTLALFLAFYLAVQAFGAVIFNPAANLLYWFAVGLLFAVLRLERRAAPAMAILRRPAPALRFQRSA